MGKCYESNFNLNDAQKCRNISQERISTGYLTESYKSSAQGHNMVRLQMSCALHVELTNTRNIHIAK